jgi:hypothetical protein
MAYKQSPGRMAMPKTGRGISPVMMSSCGSPAKQQKDPKTGMTKDKARKEIDAVFSENTRRVAAEAVAKSDSTSAANNARMLDKGLSKKMAARIGNEAANKRRKAEKIPQVSRGTRPQSGNPGGVKFKQPDVYSRDGKLEKDAKRSTVDTYRNSK